MADLKVNSTQVVATANKIKSINAQISNGFSSVQNAITRLNNVWDGSASNSAFNKFNSLKDAYCDNRYKVVDNYVEFLYQQVGEGYKQTETVNKSLADAFK